jgi:tetratricopeptide (TPR) repeat protein
VGRYLEATRWDPNYAEAYWKLGRSRQKLDQPREALEALTKYLELEPGGKNAGEARHQIAQLEKQIEKLPLVETDASKQHAGKQP